MDIHEIRGFMYKKLSDEKLSKLIESGIEEFSEKSYEKASLASIAKRAGISVGVIYKYYEDKDSFFLACVRECLENLNNVLNDVAKKSDDLNESIDSVIRALIEHAKNHRNVNRMYHEITKAGSSRFAKELAIEVEGLSALVYVDLLNKAKEENKCREDADPNLFAFFFDNLFMMIQFSFCCDYYMERMKLYCGDEIFYDDDRLASQLHKFLLGALGIQ